MKKKYTDEELIQDALKYNTRKDWQYESRNAYNVARYRKILEVCCAHMRSRFYNDDELKKIALNFKSRREWQQASKKTYIEKTVDYQK